MQKSLANWIEQYAKSLIHHDQVEFISELHGWFNIKSQLL